MRLDMRTTELILAAGRQARGLGHSYVGPQHLLIALCEEPGRLGLLLPPMLPTLWPTAL